VLEGARMCVGTGRDGVTGFRRDERGRGSGVRARKRLRKGRETGRKAGRIRRFAGCEEWGDNNHEWLREFIYLFFK